MTEANRHPLQSLGLRCLEVRWLDAGDTRLGMLTIAARTSRSLSEDDRSLLDAAAADRGRALAPIDPTTRFVRSRSLEMARLAVPEIAPTTRAPTACGPANCCRCQQRTINHPELRPSDLPPQDLELVAQHQHLDVFHV